MMALSPAEASVLVAGIAAIASVVTTIISVKDRKKVDETHKQVTVNHHSSHSPTILDRLDDIEKKVDRQGEKLDHHIEWHLMR